MNHNHPRKTFAAAAFATVFSLGGASAGADEDIDWLAIAYVWGSEVTIDARDQSVGVDFKDLVDDLEFAFQGHLEAQRDTFGAFVDVTFLGVGSNESRPNVDLNVDNDTTAIDLALVWSPGAERLTGIELFTGVRYISNDFGLVADPIPPALPTATTGSDKSYADLLLGARYIAPLSEQWRLMFHGDVSGGDTEGTWSLGAHAAYLMGPHRFIAGYRHLEVDLESGSGNALTAELSGPIIAYGFAF